MGFIESIFGGGSSSGKHSDPHPLGQDVDIPVSQENGKLKKGDRVRIPTSLGDAMGKIAYIDEIFENGDIAIMMNDGSMETVSAADVQSLDKVDESH